MRSQHLRAALLAPVVLAQSFATAQTIVRRLVDCNPKALAGQEICVCFENEGGLTKGVVRLDASQVVATTPARRLNGAVLSDIPDVFQVRLPAGLAPGEHWVTAPPLAGRARVEVVEPKIDISQSRLKRGQMSRVRFSIAGTEEKVTVTLRNATPGIVTLLDENGQPANEQTVQTSGGSSNWVIRGVRADNLGDFVIATTLDLGACPCGDRRLTEGPRQPGGVDGPPTGSTPGGGAAPRLGILLTRDDDTWIPAPRPSPAGCAPTIGTDTTSLTARLYQNAGTGWQPTTIERVVRIYFTKRSMEPGIGLNESVGQSPDLNFLSFDTKGKDQFSCVDDANGPNGDCTTLLPVSQTGIRVRALDFGAYGRADASCRDCVRLAQRADGTIVDAPGVGAGATDVTVPKDDNGNGIADAYVWDSLGRMVDDDATPAGAHAGDGLTNYEEYRGFGVLGCHVRTNPALKDLFVRNQNGADFSLFKSASGLAVWEIGGTELDAKRVVNFNRSADSSLGEQHAILFQISPSAKLVDIGAQGNCDFGPPKNVTRCAALPGSTADVYAHELGHGVGILHHGEVDTEPVELFKERDPLVDDGAAIRQLIGSATRLVANECCGKKLDVDTPANYTLGHRGDQGSGDQSCIMSYVLYGDLVKDGTAPLGYCCTIAGTRQHFCSSAAGTGQNANNACRGDADVGNCMAQIHVNDMR